MSAAQREEWSGTIGRDFKILDLATELLVTTKAAFRPGFDEWVTFNPHIMCAFVHQADAVRARGRKHYSARTIVEVLRHESVLRETPIGEWKINDHAAPDLARLYMLIRPEAHGFFELRGARVPA